MAKIDLSTDNETILKYAGMLNPDVKIAFMELYRRMNKLMKFGRELEAQLDAEGMIVGKEYVKGRPNVYKNPAADLYYKNCDCLVKVVTAMDKLVKGQKMVSITDADTDGDML